MESNRTAVPLMHSELFDRLRCPACGSALVAAGDHLECGQEPAGHSFPVVDQVPVLIDESTSVFDIASFERRDATFFCDDTPLLRMAKKLVPALGDNLVANRNYATLRSLLLAKSEKPKVLILGGSIAGAGLEHLLDPRIETVDTDVSLGPRTRAIVDAHQIPFEDGTFDAVIAQAVLEHVIDPVRCVSEIHRVLVPDGLVYIEIPFIQQVHGGRYDFTRFTQLGLRRLMRDFSEIDSGAAEGPGMALAWSLMYFMLSFSSARAVRGIARITSGLMALPLRAFDRLLINREETLDAASGFYFLGNRSTEQVSDREIIDSFKRSMPRQDTEERS